MSLHWWDRCKLADELHNGDKADWLYDTITHRCGCGDIRDNDPSTTLSHIAFPLLCALAAVSIFAASQLRKARDRSEKEADDGAKGGARGTEREGAHNTHDSAHQPSLQARSNCQAETQFPSGFARPSGQLPADDGMVGVPDIIAEEAGVEIAESCTDHQHNEHAARSVEDPSGSLVDVEPRQSPRRERLWYIDYARIVCVACVVTEHSGGEIYADRNIAWVQQWVLPYLYTISGMSFMFSSGSLWKYLFRLGVVLLVGSVANFIADRVHDGDDQQLDFFNIVFQMMYVAVIMLASFLLAPLRDALRWRARNPTAAASPKVIAWTLAWGTVTTAFVVFMSGGWSLATLGIESTQSMENSGARAYILHGPYVLGTFWAAFFLCHLACMLRSNGWMVWIILAFIYINRMAIPYSRGGHSVNVDLFAVGMLVQKVPLQGGAVVARIVREYWPIVFILLLFLSTPGVTGRCDLHPHHYLWERARFYSIELILIVMLISGAFNTSDSKQITGWLNMWALYAYCFHVCWARMFFHPIYGALFTYAAIPVFYCAQRYCKHRKALKARKSESKTQFTTSHMEA